MTLEIRPPDPVALALSTRDNLGVGGLSPVPDILLMVESAGVHAFVAPLPDGGPQGAYALEQGEPFILINSRDAVVRMRFTLAHELGHHVLSHGVAWDQLIAAEPAAAKGQDPREVAANRFAAELLAPLSAARAWWYRQGADTVTLGHIVRFAAAFGVSATVALLRLAAAGLLRPPRSLHQLQRAIEQGEHLELRRDLLLDPFADTLAHVGRGGTRLPQDMRENLLQAWRGDLLDLERVAARLRTTPDALEHDLAVASEGDA